MTLSGAITGAAPESCVQNGYGDIVVATSGPVVGLAGRGILAEESFNRLSVTSWSMAPAM